MKRQQKKAKVKKKSGAKKADFKIIHTHCERARNFVNKLNLFKIKRKISGSNYKKCILKMYHTIIQSYMQNSCIFM